MRPFSHIVAHRDVDVYDYLPGQKGGAFFVRMRAGKLRVIASTDLGWDHVSVSLPKRLPKYDEMKKVKRIFFRENEWAMELHAPVRDHINVHPNVLHLWRPQDVEIPIPPNWMV